MQDALLLWKTPPDADTFEDQQMKAKIAQNTRKHHFTDYNNIKELEITIAQITKQQEEQREAIRLKEQEEMQKFLMKQKSKKTKSILTENTVYIGNQQEKDYSWFTGKHEDAYTIIYVPPPQGWHADA